MLVAYWPNDDACNVKEKPWNWTRVDRIKDDSILSDEVFNDEPEHLLTDGCKEDDLEVFKQLFESFYGSMSQY